MCTYCAIVGEGMRQWPQPQVFPVQYWPDYNELVEKARKYDELTGNKDCEGADKLKWFKELSKRMEHIEKQLENKSAVES